MVGNKVEKRLVCLIIILLVTSCLVYGVKYDGNVQKPVSLDNALNHIPGYRMDGFTPLDGHIISFLELDDYTQTRYSRNQSVVNLYIGYYNSLNKVSSAHSPLVCFPGQGWTLGKVEEDKVQVGTEIVNFASMVASLAEHHELVLFWYQAGKKTVTSVYRNKINAVMNKLSGKGQEHSFVRVTVPLADSSEASVKRAQQEGRSFINSFFPIYMKYTEQSSTNAHN